MVGLVPLSLQQMFDSLGRPLSGAKLHTFQAGTTTPQNVYADAALASPMSNPVLADAAGRLPVMYAEDGSIKFRLDSSGGVTQLAVDSIPVLGASSGGGGGSAVDETKIFQTGHMLVRYGTGALSGYVRLNGRTIGSVASGASERANADVEALFLYLWSADANLIVSTGRGSDAAADWAANKNIALPDWRGRAIAALDDMGNTAAGRLSATYFGATATTLGAAGGAESRTVAQANLPSVNFPVSGITLHDPGHSHSVSVANQAAFAFGSNNAINSVGSIATTPATTGISITSQGSAASGGSGTPIAIVQPTMLATVYIRL